MRQDNPIEKDLTLTIHAPLLSASILSQGNLIGAARIFSSWRLWGFGFRARYVSGITHDYHYRILPWAFQGKSRHFIGIFGKYRPVVAGIVDVMMPGGFMDEPAWP